MIEQHQCLKTHYENFLPKFRYIFSDAFLSQNLPQ